MQVPSHFIFISSHRSDFHSRFHSPKRAMEQAQTELPAVLRLSRWVLQQDLFYASDAKLGCPGPRLLQHQAVPSGWIFISFLSHVSLHTEGKLASVVVSSSLLRRHSCTWAVSLELSFGHLSCPAHLRIRLHSNPASPTLSLSSPLFSAKPWSPHNRSTHISYTHLLHSISVCDINYDHAWGLLLSLLSTNLPLPLL